MMDLLSTEALKYGVTLSVSQLSAFELYYQELTDWNTRVNLTAITAYDDVQRKHFLDSLACILALEGFRTAEANLKESLERHIAPSLRFADVGSGAGFPGLPLKILFPSIRLTLIEATGKKAEFLRYIVDRLQMNEVTIVCARAEQMGLDRAHREQYDVVLARAVASLNVLAEYCLPLLRVGGRWIASKGDAIDEEISTMGAALSILGGELRERIPYQLNQVPGTRYLVVVDKITATPQTYPRRVGIPAKRPLIATI
jgi:16S rRNA (guanine527-N7)-methyltransferase